MVVGRRVGFAVQGAVLFVFQLWQKDFKWGRSEKAKQNKAKAKLGRRITISHLNRTYC